MLIGLLFRKPKLLLLVAVLVAAWYFLGGGRGCNTTMDPSQAGGLAGLFSTGATLDPGEYDKAEVYEPLADNVKNPLPERTSLERFAPPRENQGQQGSCVAWASAYAARSIIHNQATGATPSKEAAFSPSFLYNKIKIEGSGCQGSYILRAMDDMLQRGAVPFSRFAYTDRNCDAQPGSDAVQLAQRYRIKGFQRLSKSDDPRSPVDMVAMKQYLAQGSPVVIGMMVGGTFMQDMEGREIWRPTPADARMPGFGGHAMCVIGYDDYKLGSDMGAFQVMNSWGASWGRNGIAWVPYDAFEHFTREAYAVYPMGESAEARPDRFDLRFGLVNVDASGRAGGSNIPLVHAGGRVFRTATPIHKGDRFKVEVTNDLECYIYCFGQEMDGSTYVLFPNTPKHSPYCGVTGTRIFPTDQSMTADAMGTTDVMAILVFNQPIDFPDLNERLKASTTQGLDAKLQAVLGSELLEAGQAMYSEGPTVGISAPATTNGLAVVLEIDKR